MYNAFEHCDIHRDAPKASDSLQSVCWPDVSKQQPVTIIEDPHLCSYPPKPEIRWPIYEPWRQNIQESRCEGQGRCQGDPQRCNSKYRYGAEVVCPAEDAAQKHDSQCCLHCPPACPKEPCPAPPWNNNCMLR
ncbi:hypothetical protein BsWGS_22926 [Bradybaena similaris]